MRSVLSLLSSLALIGVGGCGSSIECDPAPIFSVGDGGGCVEQLRGDVDVESCFDTAQPQGHGLMQICLFDPDGGLYVAVTSSSKSIKAAGWTHSTWAGDGNLTSPQVAVCRSLSADLVFAANACPPG